MTEPLRCVIFAAVSSKPQAGDDKDSIPNQIERARSVIERRGWTEAHEPIIVPGHTRSIDFLHEAMEELPEIADLVHLARNNAVDVVVCRDYDRLARTRSLLAQISRYLSHCRVQIYALDKPVEPLPPDELGRRGRGVGSAALVEAISGLQAEGEVSRITSRRYFGMNAVMRKGYWKHSQIAYGYTRLTEYSAEDNPIYTDVPRIVPEEAAIVRRIDEMYLKDGMGGVMIARALNADGIPSPGGGKWYRSSIFGILKNPFYCGYIVWGLKRMVDVLDPETHKFVARRRPIPTVVDIEKRLGRRANVFDLMEYADELAEHDAIVTRGLHESIRSEEIQRAIYEELERKHIMGGRAVDTSGRALLFSGLLKCARCDSPMLAMTARVHDRIYYVCKAHRTRRECDNTTWTRENRLYRAVIKLLEDFSHRPESMAPYLEQHAEQDGANLRVERDGLVASLGELAGRRQRWDDAYEAEVIDLATYGERIKGLEDERLALEHRLSGIERRLDSAQTAERRRADALRLIREGIPPMKDRAATKVFLRRVIDHATVDGGEIKYIKFRF